MDILVVEDEPAICDLICDTLESAGFSTRRAADGLEAVEKIRDRKPSCVLLDVNMPRMDGFSVLEALRKDNATATLPVLMLTAQSGADDIRHAVKLGANDYVGKPFEPRQLLRRVDRMLRAAATA